MNSIAEKKVGFIVNLTYYAFLTFTVWFIVKYAAAAAFPFVLAYIPARAAQEPSEVLEGRFRHIPGGLIRAAVITMIWLLPMATLYIIASRIFSELSDFISELPDILGGMANSLLGADEVRQLESRLPEWLARPFGSAVEQLREDTAGFIMSLIDRLTARGEGLSTLGSAAMRLPAFVVTVIVSVAGSYFIGLDMAALRTNVLALMPERVITRLRRIKNCVKDTLSTLLRAYALLMMLTFAELASGFAIMNFFGADIGHILPLSIITALVDILPVLGVGTVLLPWTIVEIVSGNAAKGLMLLAMYAVIIIVRNFLEPKLVGQSFGVHPLFMLAAIYLGGRFFGLGGVFLLPFIMLIALRLRTEQKIYCNVNDDAL